MAFRDTSPLAYVMNINDM